MGKPQNDFQKVFNLQPFILKPLSENFPEKVIFYKLYKVLGTRRGKQVLIVLPKLGLYFLNQNPQTL